MKLEIAQPLAIEIARILEPACHHLAIAGSIRRQNAQPNDIELVAIPTVIGGDNALWWLLDQLLEREVITHPTKTCWGQKMRKFMFEGIKVDLFTADAHNWGYQYWLRTGPGSANTYIMKMRAQKNAPWKAKGGYIWYGDRKVSVPDEQTMFDLLGIDLIAPAFRSESHYAEYMRSPLHEFGTPGRFADTAHMVDKNAGSETVQQAPKQLSLPLDLNGLLADTNPVFFPKSASDGRKNNASTALWTWTKIWFADKEKRYVWFKLPYGYWGIIPVDSEQARQRLKRLQTDDSDRAYMEWQLKEHHLDIKAKLERIHWPDQAMILKNNIGGTVDIGGIFEPETVTRFVNIPTDLAENTQSIVMTHYMDKYITQFPYMFVDDKGDLPRAIQFNNDDRFFLYNGHHRTYLMRMLGFSHIPAIVDFVDEQLRDNIEQIHIDLDEVI